MKGLAIPRSTLSFTHPQESPLPHLTPEEMQKRSICESKPTQALLQGSQHV